jgi:hypothetical protein
MDATPFRDPTFAMELIDSYDKEQILTRKRDVIEVNWPNRLVAIEHSDKSSGPLNCGTNRMKEAPLLRAYANTMLGLIQSLQMILFGKYKPFLISTRESKKNELRSSKSIVHWTNKHSTYFQFGNSPSETTVDVRIGK